MFDVCDGCILILIMNHNNDEDNSATYILKALMNKETRN
jgi:hypothetical protein